MNKPHKHAEVLRAIADGKEVQYKLEGKWMDVTDLKRHKDPITHNEYEWRVKPEPRYEWQWLFFNTLTNKHEATENFYELGDVPNVVRKETLKRIEESKREVAQ